jgi:Ca2+-binding RTX toxin-like protein
MNSYRRRAALSCAVNATVRDCAYSCEPLEDRTFLSGLPVIVLTEAFSLVEFASVNIDTVRPWLWENPGEFQWNLSQGNWNTTDGDENGRADDAYGWNFSSTSPNIINNNTGLGGGGHGAAIMGSVLHALTTAGTPSTVGVRIMHVIGTGAQIAQYVIAEKQAGVNIVAVSSSTGEGSNFSRTDAIALRDAEILLFVGSDNNFLVSGVNRDLPSINATSSKSFFHATPRYETQQAPVHTIIPVTTNPALSQTDYGINSFYFASPIGPEQSFAIPYAATYAALAAEAYQELPAHANEPPTPEQIKQAMLSGVDYIDGLEGRTITHDYVGGEREDGGLLDIGEIVEAINESPAITGVSITGGTPAGTTVEFDLNRDGAAPTNWTISWGDNSGADQSGVEVFNGEIIPSASHIFPRDIQPHTYYPTIYAMLGAGTSRRVYLPAGTAQGVLISTNMVPTNAKEEYTLSRSGDNLLVTLGSVTQTFAPGQLPRSILRLGAGNDTVTIDFTNGDPLYFTDLTVMGDIGNLIRVIGKPTADTIISNLSSDIFVDGRRIRKPNQAIPVYVDAAGGDDSLQNGSIGVVTLKGGAGNDVINLGTVRNLAIVDGGGGIDTVLGVLGPDGVDEAVEYYTKVESNNRIVKRYDFDNLLLFSLTQTIASIPSGPVAGTTTFNVEEALFTVDIDSAGSMIYGFYSETVPLPVNSVTSLIINGQNKDEGFDIQSTVNVTINAGGGDDWISLTAPNSSINGGAGDDEIYTGNTGYYFVKPGTGTNTFFGGNGTDYVQLATGAADTIYLGGGDDIVDALYDFGDNDYLDGGAGTDTLKIYEGLERTNLISMEEIDEIPWPG